jgi:polysaccharide export outer membrane protein
MPRYLFSCIVLVLFCLLSVSITFGADSLSGSQYKLGPGDILEISVWNDEALFREVRVRPDGKISFPLIGDVTAYGRTVSELKAELEELMNEFVPGVPITVILRSLGYPRIYIVGKVAQPGPFVMETELTVIQALAMAGGLTTFASKGNILIIRKDGQQQKTLEFNYSDMERGRNLEQNIVLMPGDTVIVP